MLRCWGHGEVLRAALPAQGDAEAAGPDLQQQPCAGVLLTKVVDTRWLSGSMGLANSGDAGPTRPTSCGRLRCKASLALGTVSFLFVGLQGLGSWLFLLSGNRVAGTTREKSAVRPSFHGWHVLAMMRQWCHGRWPRM